MKSPGHIMINLCAAIFLIVTLSGFALAADDPEAVVKNFLRAAYSHDAAQFSALVFPRSSAEVLQGKDPVSSERLAEIDSELKSLQLRQRQPFRRVGISVDPNPNGYPDGTTTRYSTSFLGNYTVISLIKKEGRWLIDTRWWLKLREMSLRGEKDQLDEKELLIKKFLLDLLRLDRRAVIKSLVPGTNADIAFEGAPQVPEPSDVLPSLAIEMPLVEADPDEVYPLLSGKLVKRGPGSAPEETVMVGLYGPFEMVFLLRRIEKEWRIVPEPYYRIINR